MKLSKLLQWLLIAAMPMYMVDAADAGGGADDTPAPAEPPAGSTLSQGNDTPPADPAAAPPAHWAPEKYQVKTATGEIDIEATAKKQAEAHAALEARMGSDGTRPKTAEEYTFTVPDTLKDQWNPEEDKKYLDFKQKAHKLGYTQAQFEYAVGLHIEEISQVQVGDAVADQQATQNTLRGLWPDQVSFQRNLNAAFRGVSAYANPGDANVPGSMINIERKFSEDADFIALMANIGRETKEDLPPMGAIMSGESVDELQKSKAYWDANDPKHAEVKAKVTAHYARLYSAKN